MSRRIHIFLLIFVALLTVFNLSLINLSPRAAEQYDCQICMPLCEGMCANHGCCAGVYRAPTGECRIVCCDGAYFACMA